MQNFNNVMKICTLLSIVILISSCKVDETPSHKIDEKTLIVDEETRYYTIAVPFEYNDTDSYPLLIALHWGEPVSFQSGANFLYNFVMPSYENFNGIIISPSRPVRGGWFLSYSENFILTLLKKIKNDYNIDVEKVAIAGYSLGGIGTWYYATTYPDLFSAAIPIASMPPSSVLPISNIIPTYVIHGTSDEIFPIDNIKNLVRDIKITNNTIRLVEVENASHYDTDKYEQSFSESIDWIEEHWNN